MSVVLNRLATKAIAELSEGNRTGYYALINHPAFITHKQTMVGSLSMKLPSVSYDVLGMIYDSTLWTVLVTSDADEPHTDFMGYFAKAFINQAKTEARDTLIYRDHNDLRDFADPSSATDFTEAAMSAENAYLDSVVSIEFSRFLDTIPTLTEQEKAILRHRAEYGTSLTEIVDLMGGQYKNKQEVWRKTTNKLKKEMGRFL